MFDPGLTMDDGRWTMSSGYGLSSIVYRPKADRISDRLYLGLIMQELVKQSDEQP
jgi:hypothetical protein